MVSDNQMTQFVFIYKFCYGVIQHTIQICKHSKNDIHVFCLNYFNIS